ncbi:bZIP transcription factor 11-like [Cucurbita pepo subsp. pepo]|uniref:bZIP transcription factor 11-like n=1 Tax=Cucurbita pepo subsp. pepo TaxID=3664 RepID=UPI000C9D5F4B|nr:bZIP transcription factor 11-like [Cucurbita pepo subsp. pepo]
MASSSGTSSTSSSMEEGELAALMEQRKRKRMISNRESARRSRMRKQKHLDELMAMVAQLRKDNQQIVANLGVTTQHYAAVEAENSILRAQAAELGHRLQSLTEIISFLNPSDGVFEDACDDSYGVHGGGGGGGGGDFNPLQMAFFMSQPLMEY